MGIKFYGDLEHWGLPFGYAKVLYRDEDEKVRAVYLFSFLCIHLGFGAKNALRD